jgi:hypothetical protein
MSRQPRVKGPARRPRVHVRASRELVFTQPPDLHSDRRRDVDQELVADCATHSHPPIAGALLRFFFMTVVSLTGWRFGASGTVLPESFGLCMVRARKR